MDPVNKKLTDILERTVRVESKLDDLSDIKKTADEAREVAYSARSRAKGANLRLDRYDRVIFWIITTVLGIVLVAVLNNIII